MVIDRTYRGMETEVQIRCNDVGFADGVATLRIPCEQLDDAEVMHALSRLDWPEWAIERVMTCLHTTSRDVLVLMAIVGNER